jgi:hypothetical protein
MRDLQSLEDSMNAMDDFDPHCVHERATVDNSALFLLEWGVSFQLEPERNSSCQHQLLAKANIPPVANRTEFLKYRLESASYLLMIETLAIPSYRRQDNTIPRAKVYAVNDRTNYTLDE